jgi:hypothetical protein
VAESLEQAPAVLEAQGFGPEGQGQLMQFFQSRRVAWQLSMQFQPEVLAAPIHTLWAAQTLLDGVRPDHWQPFTRQPEASRSHTLPGRHHDFAEGPNAAPIARILDELDAAAQPVTPTERTKETAS